MKRNVRYTFPLSSRGFALVTAIVLMAFVLLLCVSLSSLLRLESQATGGSVHQGRARENARTGLLIALGNLQSAAGPDQRVMAVAEAFDGTQSGANHWLGVWNTMASSSQPVWLVSGVNPSPDRMPADAITIIGENTLGRNVDDADKVLVPKVSLDDGSGSFAWWISDQSMKVTAAEGWRPVEALEAINTDYFIGGYKIDSVKKSLSRRVPMRRGLEEIFFSGVNPDDANFAKILTLSQLNGLSGTPVGADSSFHDVSLLSYGLLTNPSEGGFKYNLTGALSDPYGFLNDSLVAFLGATRRSETGTRTSPYSGRSPFTARAYLGASGVPMDSNPTLVLTPPLNGTAKAPLYPDFSRSGRGYAFYAPILTDLLLRLSFVADVPNLTSPDPSERATRAFIRSDFICETWNPYPFAMELSRIDTSDATLPPFRMYFNDFTSNMVTLTNKRDTGAGYEPVSSVTIDMNQVGENTQFDSNLAIPSYIQYFYDSLDSGGATKSPALLYPGEIYAGRHPHNHRNSSWDTNKYQLLSYVPEGVDKWTYTAEAADLSTPAPAPTIGWLHADDIVEVKIDGTFNFTISPTNQNTLGMYNQKHIDNAQIYITDIPFETKVDIPVKEMGGNPVHFFYDNNRRLHDRDDYHVAIRLRLKDGLGDLERLSAELDPRTPRVSWDQIKDYYDLEYLRTGDIDGVAFSENDLFRHKSDHAQGPVSYRYRSEEDFHTQNRFVSLFDVPTHPAISLDVFRSAYFVDMPAFSFGEPQSGAETAEGRLNAAYDRYFMTGIDYTWEPVMREGRPLTALPNPNLFYPDWNDQHPTTAAKLQDLLKGQDAAEQLLVAGSFDVNSLSVPAWAAVLASPQYVKDDMETPMPGVIMHMPHQPLADRDIQSALTDAELAALPGTGDSFRDAVFTQTVRVFDDPAESDSSSTLYSLAEYLVDEIRGWQRSHGRPFYSMEEFANSGVLKDAIQKSGINTLGGKDIPALSPLYISQSKLLGIIANFSTVRGDTFLIRSYGESRGPITQETRGIALCEAIVQRLPEFVDSDENDPSDSLSMLGPGNAQFGRRFHVVAFSWLQGEEQ